MIDTTLSDSTLPGLFLALDRDALLELLERHLPEARNDLRLVDARVVDVQYTPGSGAHVLWKLVVRDTATDRHARQLITVRALPRHEPLPAAPDSLIRRYHELRRGDGRRSDHPLRTPWLTDASGMLVVQAFPLDPALPSLLDVTDPGALKQALHRAWQPRNVSVRRVRPELLSYTPAARAALRYEVLAENKRTAVPELRRLVGKVDARRTPARLFTGHWAVWRRTFGRTAIAPPAGYLAVAHLSLQEFVTGTRLSDLVGQGRFLDLARQTARGIAHVHRLTLPLLRERGVDREMSSVDRWCGVLARLRPEQAQRLGTLRDRLARELAARIRPIGAVHADFHLANVLADGHGVTIIDWDQVAHGDPMVDVGRFLASLRVASLRVHGTVDGCADVGEAFLQAYLAVARDDERRARLFEAASLLVAAAAPFRLQRDGWQHGADRMLDEVEHALQRSLAGPTVSGGGVAKGRGVPFEQRADWALDAAYAQALLVPIVHEAHGSDIEVTECHPVLEEQNASRFRVRWTLKGYRGRERWRAAVDGVGHADQSGHGLMHRVQLARAVLQAHAGALQLPRPIGHLGPLSMLVFERTTGEPLSRLLGSAHESATLERVAEALARFQSLDLEIVRDHETGSELDRLERRVSRLVDDRHAGAARQLIRQFRDFIVHHPRRRAAAIRRLRLDSVRVGPASVDVATIDDLVLADPLLNAAELTARLRERQLTHRRAAPAADRFAGAWTRAAGAAESDLAVFESLFLLRRALSLSERKPADPQVSRLFDAALRQVETAA